MALSLLLLLSCAPKLAEPADLPAAGGQAGTSAAPAGQPGVIGIKFRPLPEGMLVIGLSPGMGAEKAGLQVGDLIVSVDGQAVGAEGAEGSGLIKGAPGTQVSLQVRGPYGQDKRTVAVERGLPVPAPQAERPRPELPPQVVRTFQGAMRRKEANPAAIQQALDAMVAAQFEGYPPGDAVANPLRTLTRDQPEVARQVAPRLAAVKVQDWEYYLAVGESLHRLGLHKEAVAALQRSDALRPADYVSGSGERGDLGGWSKGRRLLAEAAWAAGERDLARQVAGTLARTQILGPLAEKLELPPPAPGAVWTAPLPAVADFQVKLADGSSWSLAEHRDDVVLLTFWATWCGPCRKELPELQERWAKWKEQGVELLAISMDDPDKADEVKADAQKMGLTFPVAHSPAVARAWGISSIPAVRVLGRGGSMQYVAKGYSPDAIARLEKAVGEALAAPPGADAPLGEVWSAKSASLHRFLPVSGLWDVWAGEGRVVLGVEGASPLVLESLPESVEPELIEGAGEPALAWLGGPVVADPGGLVVRAWDPDGGQRWMITTADPIVDVAASGDLLWIATEEEVAVVSGGGKLKHRFPVALDDLAPAAGGAWGLGDGRRWWLPAGGEPEDRGVAAMAGRIEGGGGTASQGIAAVVRGRFGPGGAERVAVVREDNLVIALDGAGQPAFTWRLSQPSRLAAADLDGDGRDELLVAIRRQGLAAVSLDVP